uniref:AlNc14C3G451 protein n=1 Tax=Albugo laibachii Nc14 TaxID=890382 RepID=F0VZX3_9STRA|nr:AlNc14C3G451 [Albugo laibachii Nc14]|eukprot:CCA14344.1 AlNc14C3G451 [Albugo laibachii Nc14]
MVLEVALDPFRKPLRKVFFDFTPFGHLSAIAKPTLFVIRSWTVNSPSMKTSPKSVIEPSDIPNTLHCKTSPKSVDTKTGRHIYSGGIVTVIVSVTFVSTFSVMAKEKDNEGNFEKIDLGFEGSHIREQQVQSSLKNESLTLSCIAACIFAFILATTAAYTEDGSAILLEPLSTIDYTFNNM